MLHGPPAIEQPLSKRVLFVLSNERSGSSLLQLCLNAHSSLHAGQELYLLPFSTVDERGFLLPFEMKEGLLKNLMELRRCTFGDAYEWVDEQERKQMPIWQLYDALQYLCAPQILVDKTPHNADHPSFLDHAESIFSSAARYCHLVRHPYACIESGLELRRDMSMNWNVTWEEVECAYVRLQTNVRAFFQDRSGHNIRICYEDLLRNTRITLCEVCTLMALEFQDGMDEPYESHEALASFTAGSLLATTDPKLLRRKKIDGAQADKWRTVKLPQPLQAQTLVIANAYGYELLQHDGP
jgi:hypothetical protein